MGEAVKNSIKALDLNTRYVDDILAALLIDMTLDEFKNLNKDQLEIAVMVRLKQVADDIVKMLEFTHDQPSSHSEKWMPVLDLQVRPENGQLQFKYYEKDCSNSQVIAARSAMNMTDKVTSLIQEGLRRMLNTSQSLPPNVINSIMEDFVVKPDLHMEVWLQP